MVSWSLSSRRSYCCGNYCRSRALRQTIIRTNQISSRMAWPRIIWGDN